AGRARALPSRPGCAPAGGRRAPTGCARQPPAPRGKPAPHAPGPRPQPCTNHLTNRWRAVPRNRPPPSSDSTGLLDPELVDQDVPLRVPLVVPDPLRQEVDLLRVVEVDPRSLIGHVVVNLRP